MKKITFLLTWLVLVTWPGWSQETRVGYGEVTGKHVPIEPYYGYSYTQQIYLASEINVPDGGTITALKFYYTGDGISSSNEWTVYIGHTSKTEFGSNTDWVDVSELTQVFSGNIGEVNGEGWITIDIDDWNYNGSDNLLIAVNETQSGYDGSSDEFYATEVQENRSLVYYNDNNPADPSSPPEADGVQNYIADVILVGLASACPSPSDQTVLNVTSTSAQLDWEETGSATTWEIEYGIVGFEQGTGTVVEVTEHPYTLDGLDPATYYDWYVRAKCSDDAQSAWLGPNTFQTLVGSNPFPLTEDFENGFTYFKNAEINTTDFEIQDTLVHGGSAAAVNKYGPNNDNILLETGAVDLTDATAPYLAFWQIAKTEGGYDKCYVEISTDNGLTYEALADSLYLGTAGDYADKGYFHEDSYSEWGTGSETPDNTWWKKEIFDLSPYIGQSVTVRFRLKSDGSVQRSGWFLDDISIYNVDCPVPTGVAVDDITDTTVDIHWDAVSAATSFEWVIVEHGIDPESGEYTAHGTVDGDGSADPDVDDAGQLQPLTEYDVYVRANCSDDNYSDWSAPVTFTTKAALVALPVAEDFENGYSYFDNAPGNGADFEMEDDIVQSGSLSVHNAYDNNQTNILRETVRMDLSDADHPTFEFWQIAKTEGGYDKCYVEISTDDGETFTALPASAYLGNAADYADKGYFHEDSYSEWGTGNETPDNTWWKKEIFDLSSFAGDTVTIRFRLKSDGSTVRAGWYIDRISIYDAECPYPSDLAVSDITSDSAQLNWQDNSNGEEAYIVQWKAEGEDTWSSDTTAAGATSYALSGLEPATTYQWQISGLCNNESIDPITGPTFTTECAIQQAPFTENFDEVEAPDLPVCWKKYVQSSSDFATVATISSGAYSDPNAAKLYNSSDDDAELLLISPQFSDLGNQSNQIRFMAKGSSDGINLLVGTLSDPSDATTFTALDTITLTESYEEYTVSLADYSGSDQYFAFKHGGGATYKTIYIDDVNYEVIPSCAKPTGVEVDNITTNSADLHWDAVENAQGFEYVIVLKGNDPESGEYIVQGTVDGDGSADPDVAGVQGLEPAVSYDLYVRTICGENEYSDWTAPYTFTTVPLNDACENATVIDAIPFSETLDASGATNNNGIIDVCVNGDTHYKMNDGVWYTFTPQQVNDSVTVRVTPDGWDVELQIYSGSCDNLECVAHTDSGLTGEEETITFLPEAGVTYYINVGHWHYSEDRPEGPFTIEVTGDVTLSNEVLTREEFSFYPNPTQGVVRWTSAEQPESIQVLNLAGQVIFEVRRPKGQSLDLQRLPQGVYMLRVSVDGKQGLFKLIKE